MTKQHLQEKYGRRQMEDLRQQQDNDITDQQLRAYYEMLVSTTHWESDIDELVFGTNECYPEINYDEHKEIDNDD